MSTTLNTSSGEPLIKVDNHVTPKKASSWKISISLTMIVLFTFIGLTADLITQGRDMYWPTALSWEDDPLSGLSHRPDERTWLGTIAARTFHRQIDVFTGLILGFRSAMLFGVSAALLTGMIGMILGAIGGMIGNWIQVIIARLADALLTVPLIVGVILIQQIISYFVGGLSLFRLFYNYEALTPHLSPELLTILEKADPIWLAIVLFGWMPYTRLVNTLVMKNKDEGYVQAAKALGASPFRLFFRHILPNSISPLLVLLTKDIGGFVLLQATFTFIDLGSSSEWGTMLAFGRDWIIGLGGTIFGRWWVYIPTTLVLILFGSVWNLLGDGISDRLNPHQVKITLKES